MSDGFNPVLIVNELATREQASYPLKPHNEAQIVWNSPEQPQKTAFTVLYLHGFGASHGEGDPLHKVIATQLNANLVLSRLAGHGELRAHLPFEQLTLGELIQSAAYFIDLAKKVGEKVVIVACSTGACLALRHVSFQPEGIHALILLSPLVKLYGAKHFFSTGLLKSSISKNLLPQKVTRTSPDASKFIKVHWYDAYHINGVSVLQELIDSTMTVHTFSKITCPLFMGFYYKDEQHQDTTVSIKAMMECFELLATEAGKKKRQSFPMAGHHVIQSPHLSGAYEQVQQEVAQFLDKFC